MNMNTFLSNLFAIIVAILTISAYYRDYNMQKKIIKAREYRKEKGTFNIDSYVNEQKYIKDIEWKKQKNNGPNPNSLKQPINIRNYSTLCSGIVDK